MEKNICVLCPEEILQRGKEFADFLNAPLNPASPQDYFFHFNVSADQIYVSDAEQRRLEIDFEKNHLDYQRKGHRGKNELIAKALGVAKGYRRVLDLSVGMGIDSIFLKQLGFEVIGVERSPVLYSLLREAFKKSSNPMFQNYQLYHSDASRFLSEQRGSLAMDAIYFDPMYPHKKKSALPKQEMVLFRDLVGNDEDAAQVLQQALLWPVQRVVVKRPIHAHELLPGVRHSYLGKVVRYDTYMVG